MLAGLLDRLKAHWLKLSISLVLAAGFVWMFQKGGLPFLPTAEVRSHIRWWCVPVYTVVMLSVSYLRMSRWKYLLRAIGPVDDTRVAAAGLVGYGVILLAPLRAGELVRPLLVARDGKVTFVQASGTVAAERIIDGLIISLILLAGTVTAQTIHPLPDHLGALPLPMKAVPQATRAALALFTCAFAAMGIFYWQRDLARRATHAVVGLVSERLATWLTEKVERVADGLSFLPSRAHSLPYLRDTLVYFALNLLLTYVGLRGCGVPVGIANLFVIVGVMALGILIPAGPGFFGAYQLSGFCALAMFFPEDVVLGPGAAFIFVSYTIQLIVTIAGMPIGAYLLRGDAARPSPAAHTPAADV